MVLKTRLLLHKVMQFFQVSFVEAVWNIHLKTADMISVDEGREPNSMGKCSGNQVDSLYITSSTLAA